VQDKLVTFAGVDTEASPTERPSALLQTGENVRLDRNGVLMPRRGYVISTGAAFARDIVACAGFVTGSGEYAAATCEYSSSSGTNDLYTVGAVSLYSTISQAKRARLCVHNKRLYMVDGWRPMQRWDGIASASVAAGITGPSTASGAWAPTPTTAAGNCTAGTHKFRYRYLDSTTGYVSEPSNEYVATVVAGSQQLTFAINTSGAGNIIRSTDAKVDKVVVEMTLTGGTKFYKAAEGIQSASTIVVSISDVTLANQPAPWPDTGTLDAGVHYPPPVTSHVYSFRGRLWCFGQCVHNVGTVTTSNGSASVTGSSTDFTAACALPSAPIGTNRVVRRFKVASAAVDYEVASTGGATSLTLSTTYAGSTTSGLSYSIYSNDRSIFYSAPGYPEAFPPFNYILGPESGPITGMIGHQNALMLFSLNGMERFVWTSDPNADGTKRTIPTNRGLVRHECAVNVEEVVYGLDQRGFWRYDGEVPTHLSSPIETYVARINWSASDTFHGCFYPRSRAIRWWVALDSDTKPYHYLQYDVDRRTWTTGNRGDSTNGPGCASSAVIPTSTGVRVLNGLNLYSTSSLSGWVYDDEGEVDGTLGWSGSVQGTVTGTSSTTTRLYLSGVTIPASTQRGTPVYVDGYGFRMCVASNQASNYIDLGVALASIPPVGTRVHLGYIPAEFRTKAFRSRARNGGAKHVGKAVTLHFVPPTVETGEVARVKVRIYRDWSTTAMTWGRVASSVAGATAPATGETDWLVDLTTADGVVSIPLGCESVQITEVEVEQTDAGVPLELLGVTIDGVDLEPVT